MEGFVCLFGVGGVNIGVGVWMDVLFRFFVVFYYEMFEICIFFVGFGVVVGCLC